MNGVNCLPGFSEIAESAAYTIPQVGLRSSRVIRDDTEKEN